MMANEKGTFTTRAKRLFRLILTRPERLTNKQRQLRDDLVAACPEMIDLDDLVTSFAQLLKPSQVNNTRLDDWITTRQRLTCHTCTPSPAGLLKTATPSTPA